MYTLHLSLKRKETERDGEEKEKETEEALRQPEAAPHFLPRGCKASPRSHAHTHTHAHPEARVTSLRVHALAGERSWRWLLAISHDSGRLGIAPR